MYVLYNDPLIQGDCLTSLREVVSRHKEAEAEADLSIGEDR